MLKRSASGIPYVDWGGEGTPLHLAHANGFPPGTYTAFADLLTPHYRVMGMESRALWGTDPPSWLQHWRQLGEDLARFLSDMSLGPTVLCGHSVGAVASLYCAIGHPEKVRHLVLIDPVIVPPAVAPIWALAMLLGLNRSSPLAKGARRRRVEWPNRATVLRSYRSAPVFRRWQSQFLEDYVASVYQETDRGAVRLRYPPEWESRIFETPPPDVWLHMPRLRGIPLLVLRGQRSNTFQSAAMKCMQRLLPAGRFEEIADADHFVPMTQPQRTVECIISALRSERASPETSRPLP